MADTIFVKPAQGLMIRYPHDPRRLLPEDGAEVAATSYWLRRLRDGSIMRVIIPEVKAGKGGNKT